MEIDNLALWDKIAGSQINRKVARPNPSLGVGPDEKIGFVAPKGFKGYGGQMKGLTVTLHRQSIEGPLTTTLIFPQTGYLGPTLGEV